MLAVTHADVSALMDPGEIVPFEISSKPHKINPARYELLIIVARYRLTPTQYYLHLLVLIISIVFVVTYMRKRRG